MAVSVRHMLLYHCAVCACREGSESTPSYGASLWVASTAATGAALGMSDAASACVAACRSIQLAIHCMQEEDSKLTVGPSLATKALVSACSRIATPSQRDMGMEEGVIVECWEAIAGTLMAVGSSAAACFERHIGTAETSQLAEAQQVWRSCMYGCALQQICVWLCLLLWTCTVRTAQSRQAL